MNELNALSSAGLTYHADDFRSNPAKIIPEFPLEDSDRGLFLSESYHICREMKVWNISNKK